MDKLLGRPEAAARALATLRAEEKRDAELRQPPIDPAVAEKARREAGLIQSATFYEPATKDLRPGRMAEYAAADEVALSVLVLALLLAAGARAALIGASALSRRASEPPNARPFIGWRRVARVVLLGGALPALLYGVYCYMPVSGRGYGLPTTGPRVVMEYAAVAAVVAFLLRRLTERAVRQRLAELGLPATPAHGSRWGRAVGLGLAIAVIVTVAAWQVRRREHLRHEIRDRAIAAAGARGYCGGVRGSAVGTTPVSRRSASPADGWPAPANLVAPLSRFADRDSRATHRGVPGLGAMGVPAPLGRLAARLHGRGTGLWAVDAGLGRVPDAGAASDDRTAGPRAPADTPAALYGRALVRSAAVTYAATALVVGGLGAVVCRAEERQAVSQFDRAGYNFFDEVQRSRFRVVRERAVAELRQSSPSTLP